MTWQDSLRQLDARLANGEIGAAEYRKTRDEILAEASSGTQSVSFDAEVTQWVSMPPPPPPAAAAEESSDDEPTQIVAADVVAPPQPPPMPSMQPPPPQFGPPPQMPRPAPPIMGSEVFAEARPSGGGRRWAFILIPLLVLALAGAGVWWFVLRDDGSPATAQDQGQTTTTTTTTAPATTSVAGVPTADDVAEMVPKLPGQAKPESGTMTPDQAQQQKLLNPAYARLLSDGGAKQLVYNKSAGNGYGYLLIAAPVEPAGHASDLATATSDDLKNSGFAPAQSDTGQPAVFTRTDQYFRTFVTMYAAGDVWVQLNVSAAPDADENALRTEFDNVLAQVLEQLPAR